MSVPIDCSTSHEMREQNVPRVSTIVFEFGDRLKPSQQLTTSRSGGTKSPSMFERGTFGSSAGSPSYFTSAMVSVTCVRPSTTEAYVGHVSYPVHWAALRTTIIHEAAYGLSVCNCMDCELKHRRQNHVIIATERY